MEVDQSPVGTLCCLLVTRSECLLVTSNHTGLLKITFRRERKALICWRIEIVLSCFLSSRNPISKTDSALRELYPFRKILSGYRRKQQQIAREVWVFECSTRCWYSIIGYSTGKKSKLFDKHNKLLRGLRKQKERQGRCRQRWKEEREEIQRKGSNSGRVLSSGQRIWDCVRVEVNSISSHKKCSPFSVFFVSACRLEPASMTSLPFFPGRSVLERLSAGVEPTSRLPRLVLQKQSVALAQKPAEQQPRSLEQATALLRCRRNRSQTDPRQIASRKNGRWRLQTRWSELDETLRCSLCWRCYRSNQLCCEGSTWAAK